MDDGAGGPLEAIFRLIIDIALAAPPGGASHCVRAIIFDVESGVELEFFFVFVSGVLCDCREYHLSFEQKISLPKRRAYVWLSAR